MDKIFTFLLLTFIAVAEIGPSDQQTCSVFFEDFTSAKNVCLEQCIPDGVECNFTKPENAAGTYQMSCIPVHGDGKLHGNEECDMGPDFVVDAQQGNPCIDGVVQEGWVCPQVLVCNKIVAEQVSISYTSVDNTIAYYDTTTGYVLDLWLVDIFMLDDGKKINFTSLEQMRNSFTLIVNTTDYFGTQTGDLTPDSTRQCESYVPVGSSQITDIDTIYCHTHILSNDRSIQLESVRRSLRFDNLQYTTPEWANTTLVLQIHRWKSEPIEFNPFYQTP